MQWHPIWHPFWHIFWHSNWHNFWHSFWHVFVPIVIFVWYAVSSLLVQDPHLDAFSLVHVPLNPKFCRKGHGPGLDPFFWQTRRPWDEKSERPRLRPSSVTSEWQFLTYITIGSIGHENWKEWPSLWLAFDILWLSKMTHQVVATLAGHCWTFAEPAAPFRQTQENLGDVANQNLGVMIYIYLYDVYDTYDIYI